METNQSKVTRHSISVVFNFALSDEDIDDIMSAALDGGITYWCCKAKVVGKYLGEYASEQIARGGVLLLYDSSKGRVRKGIKNDRADFESGKVFEECRLMINEILNSDYSELGLNREETLKREKQQIRLRKAIREACLGDAGDREYLKEYLKELLQNRLGVNEQTITKIIPFDNPSEMSAQDKFELMFSPDYLGPKNFETTYNENGDIVITVDGYTFVPDLNFMNTHAVCRYCGNIYCWDYE